MQVEPPLRGSTAGELCRGSKEMEKGKVIQARDYRAWMGGVAEKWREEAGLEYALPIQTAGPRNGFDIGG